MTYITKIHGTASITPSLRAWQIFKNCGADKFVGGKLIVLGNDRFAFEVPQAFTTQHPAIRYIIDNA